MCNLGTCACPTFLLDGEPPKDQRVKLSRLRPPLSHLAGALLASALAAGCGTTDDRPATLEVISLEILAPTCGPVQCHSTTSRIQGYAFDTLDASRSSLRDLGVSAGRGGALLEVIGGDAEERMPPDMPMFEPDVRLIEKWIADGAPGL
jgi:hypothetical protein